MQGGFTEGLSKTQLALGMYADEVGNVYDITGKLVGQTDKAANTVAHDKSLSRLLRTLGDTSAVRNSLCEYNDAIKRIAEAFNNGAIQTEERDKLYNEANSSLIEALQKEKAAIDDATARRRKSLRDSLGVDSYLETLKTPIEKYNETVAKIDEALKEGAINRQEAAAMEGKAQGEYWQKLAETARENLNRPSWLLSKQLSKVVRMYDKDGKIWSMVGILKESSSKRDPGYYFRFHEGGWRPNYKHKLTVEKRFVRRAKQATTPILKGEIAKASKEVTDVFKAELEKIRNRKK